MLKFLKSFLNIREHKKQLLFLILLAFLISFSLAHAYSIFIVRSFYYRGYHIHHFYFGTLALVAAGFIGILNKGKKSLRFASILLGVGMGLFGDEIGLLLNCTSTIRECSYAFPDTIDIFGTIALAILLLIILIDLIERFYLRNKGVKDNKEPHANET